MSEQTARTTLLAQTRPSSTSAATAYTAPAGTRVEVKKIVIANTTGSAVTYRLFHHDTGTTYDQTTALAYDVSVPANSSHVWSAQEDDGIGLRAGGSVGVRTDTNNALTFSIYGVVQVAR